MIETERTKCPRPETNPLDGTVSWAPSKSIWYSTHLLIAFLAGPLTWTWSASLICGALTVLTLCCGHSVGLHRLLIHRSFATPLWLKRSLVYLGTLVGMGGPFTMIRLHDLRDWSQRHERCHPFFIHQNTLFRDWIANLHSRIALEHPPEIHIEPEVAGDPVFRFLEKTDRWQQLPLALLLFAGGGISWVVWGISVRITMSLTGHWLVGYIAHNTGDRIWHMKNQAVQGYNVRHLGLLTMGESWHNNHHAFPGSARLGHSPKQHDPGWWFISLLERTGLAREIRTPKDFPESSIREAL
ncbi:acyl-CoA desaturase [Verrucomicrobiales bacterium BCK34]|nr:acyl-CoA desaturase [Verrucomicrobiales bacterium BCK34]